MCFKNHATISNGVNSVLQKKLEQVSHGGLLLFNNLMSPWSHKPLIHKPLIKGCSIKCELWASDKPWCVSGLLEECGQSNRFYKWGWLSSVGVWRDQSTRCRWRRRNLASDLGHKWCCVKEEEWRRGSCSWCSSDSSRLVGVSLQGVRNLRDLHRPREELDVIPEMF